MPKTSLKLALTLALALPGAAQAQERPVAATEYGRVEGLGEAGVESFKGIPFAAPPVGDLRWRAPQPAAAWNGVRDAGTYGHDCMQVPFPSDAAPLGTTPSEDCLYANVWRPAGSAGKKLPVIFWIYGGGFVNGGASPPTYSGERLARRGAVVISANYRVGRFGTFAHPQLTAQDPDNGLLGNYGYLDQIAALKWVEKNAAAFGGDPDNVTIIGESAGGMSVHTLLTSPLAQGLFHKAVVMSGGNGGSLGAGKLADVEKLGQEFAAGKGIAATDPHALAKLRMLSAEEVTDGLNMMKLFVPSKRDFASPFVDGRIAVDVGAAYAAGQFAKVPVMIGATSADSGGKTGFMVAGAKHASAAIAKAGAPVYAYRFSYVAESLKDPGALHATDIPFFFDTQDIKYGAQTTPRDNAAGKVIADYLVNFARTGTPEAAGQPKWPVYDPAADRIMDFAASGKAVVLKDPWGAEINTPK